MKKAVFDLSSDSLLAREPQGLTRFRNLGYQNWLLMRNQINLHYFWEKTLVFYRYGVGRISNAARHT